MFQSADLVNAHGCELIVTLSFITLVLRVRGKVLCRGMKTVKQETSTVTWRRR